MRCVILLALLLASLASAERASWRFYPINTTENGVDTDGLMLYFTGPVPSSIPVTVEAIQDGAAVSVSQSVIVRPVNGLFQIKIDESSRHKLIQITMKLDGYLFTWRAPVSGRAYQLPERRPE